MAPYRRPKQMKSCKFLHKNGGPILTRNNVAVGATIKSHQQCPVIIRKTRTKNNVYGTEDLAKSHTKKWHAVREHNKREAAKIAKQESERKAQEELAAEREEDAIKRIEHLQNEHDNLVSLHKEIVTLSQFEENPNNDMIERAGRIVKETIDELHDAITGTPSININFDFLITHTLTTVVHALDYNNLTINKS